jgi:hypothetical protein
MAAIVTDTHRKLLTDFLLSEIATSADSNQYYIGIGKSDVWNSTDTLINPLRSAKEERDHRNNLQSVKKVEASSFVIPRYNWSSGSIFSSWTDDSIGIPTNSYYVMTDINEVFICIKQAKNSLGVAQTSTVKPAVPAGKNIYAPFELSDGYVWKFLYGLSAGTANSFLSANFIPIQKITNPTNAFQTDQKSVQDNAISGQIIGIELDSNGAGYGSTVPSVTIRGNGSSAAATATLNNGQVVKVEMDNESAGLGSGYDFAEIIFDGSPSKPAKARAIIGPKLGLGNDARSDLKASSIMLNIKPDGTVSDTFIVGNSFRQISLFKGLREKDSSAAGTIFSGTSSRTQRYMRAQSVSDASSITAGREITDGSTPKIRAYVDQIDSDFIYYHQNDSSGFGVFANSATISDGINSITIDSGNAKSLVDPYSGDLLYVENRAKILRDTSQQEDIKVIITV